MQSSLDSGIQSQTQQCRARRSLERKRKLRRPDTPGRVNAQAAVFTSSNHKPRRAGVLTTHCRKTIGDTIPALALPPTSTDPDGHQDSSTACDTQSSHFLPGHDSRHIQDLDIMTDFEMNELDTEQQLHEFRPPIPDIKEESENSCTEKDTDYSLTSSSVVKPPSAPIDVPLHSRSSTSTSSAGSSPVSTFNFSRQSSTDSSWSLVSLNSPKDLSPEKSWKSNVLNFLRKFNPFSQDATESSQPQERTQEKYMLGFGFRM